VFKDNNPLEVLVPHSIGEIISMKRKHPEALFWAGGTYIMGSEENFGKEKVDSVISLAHVSELSRITRNERYLEFGSMVPIQRLLEKGIFTLSEEARQAVGRIGTEIIRSKATIGGSLCTESTRFYLSAIFSVLDAQVELRSVTKHSIAKWYSVSKIYDRDGNFIFKDKALLTRIRFSSNYEPNQFFKIIGSPMKDPDNSVMFASQFSINQTNISSIQLCLVFPSAGFHISTEMENKIKSFALPISPASISSVADSFAKEIKTQHPKAKDLQVEKSKRLLMHILFEANSDYLAS